MGEYGDAGLRTLCLAFAELDERVYTDWQRRWMEAKTTVVSADVQAANLEALAEEIEKNLVLSGCTAIEDKLQEGVPECIDSLARAGLKLWVLTGDKLETAINIGYACSLLRQVGFRVSGLWGFRDSFLLVVFASAHVGAQMFCLVNP
jgi:phospholipid-translocating ATPase